jgi:metal-sulfur cluster biosynthetic enzyme
MQSTRDLIPASRFPLVYFSAMESPTPQTAQTPESLRKALRGVKDPELNLNIIDIGLVYDTAIDENGAVQVKMTLTSPGCPAGAEIVGDVKRTLEDLEGVTSVDVEIVWEPYWTPEKMDPRVRAFLGG